MKVILLSSVLAAWNYAENRALGLLPWFMVAVILGALLQHLRIDVLTKGSLRRRSATAAATTTVFGAFTPFCACSIVPLIRSFLLAGVPVSVVMAFWIASPAVSPEIFGLTAAAFGIKIALARLIGAIVLALGASAAARVMERRGWLSEVVRPPKQKKQKQLVTQDDCCTPAAPGSIALAGTGTGLTSIPLVEFAAGTGLTSIPLVESTAGSTALLTRLPITESGSCCGPTEPVTLSSESSCCGTDAVVDVSPAADPEAGVPWRVLAKQSLKQVSLWDFSRDLGRDTWLMGRWMLLAILIEALVVEYVPPTAFNGILNGNVVISVVIAALLSVPLYLNGISAIPIGASLVSMGMSPAGLTTFMLAGAITTLPAMAGVRAVVHPRIFRLYLTTGVLGSIIVGLLSAPFVG